MTNFFGKTSGNKIIQGVCIVDEDGRIANIDDLTNTNYVIKATNQTNSLNQIFLGLFF